MCPEVQIYEYLANSIKLFLCAQTSAASCCAFQNKMSWSFPDIKTSSRVSVKISLKVYLNDNNNNIKTNI